MSKKNYIKLFGIALSAIIITIGVISGIITVLDSMKIDHIFKEKGFLAFLCFALISIISGLIAVIIELIRNNKNLLVLEDGFTDKNLDSLLITLIEKSLNQSLHKREYNEVIRLGTVLSRPLWLSGKYNSRIQIGRLVEEAAGSIGKKNEQAQALIDDIGWTNAEMGNYPEAIKNINHGIEIVQKIPNHYLLAKGLRHLGGIAKRTKLFVEAKAKYSAALEAAEKITDSKEAKEMMAGIEYALGNLCFELKDFINAEKHIETALIQFRELKDTERAIKTISIKANLYLEKGEIDNAKDMFREGLKLSRDNDRKDEIVLNLKGLSKIYFLENNVTKAMELKNEADIIAKAIGIKNIN